MIDPIEDREIRLQALTGDRDPQCICGDGFGMNLSCTLHKPWGREIYDAMKRRGAIPVVGWGDTHKE